MPMPSEMGIAIPPAVKAAIIADINNAINALNSVKVVQLTAAERQAAQSIAETRAPYVVKAINVLAPAHTALQPGFLSLVNATNDLNTFADITELNLLVKELVDRATDLGLAAEHHAYLYTRKFYGIAKDAQDTNTAGADTVVSELAPLFEGQGTVNPIPEP
jgi:hypothetical protein